MACTFDRKGRIERPDGKCNLRTWLPQQLALAQSRPVVDSHRRHRLLSGKRRARPSVVSGRHRGNSAGCRALAWGRTGQLVRPYSHPQTNAAAWLEPVSDEEYRKATTEAESRYAEANEVLTVREQAIVAVASYTGKGDLEHLKPALTQALEAGMTINEINEVLIHAYAYCGFPRSLRAIQTFMQVVDERKAAGINDPVGREASAVKDDRNRYERGRDVLAEISGTPADAPKAGYAVFAPTIERFLKEHLFTDLFERDLLTCRERELATVSILAGVSGVEPMAVGHMSICLHLGITPEQLSALLNIVEMNLGKNYSEPLRKVLNQITEKK